jgi:predicted transcriptional regulator
LEYGTFDEAVKMSDIVDKWGEAVAERGFAQVPNYLLLLNRFLDEEKRLSPIELLVLIQLVGAWWQKDRMPFPSMATLATRIGVSERQVQRSMVRLVKDGFLSKVKRRTKGIIATNAYDLSPLVQLLNDVAKAFPNEFPRMTRKNPNRDVSEFPPRVRKLNIRRKSIRNPSKSET